MAAQTKNRKATTIDIKVVNNSLNLAFTIIIPTIQWLWFIIPIGAGILIWRPELTEYIKAIILLVQQ